MKYVALLSGGKDSCFNLLHCHKNGHELIAAASLAPESGKEEIDSYLYQTVGQDAIEFVARALEVPLYRKNITGAAVEQGSEYGNRVAHSGIEGDETEDMFSLLSTVKSSHPEIQGVSVGAILSNYQRVRVEHVCRRLSLTPLCYLWRRDQAELLSEMIEAGMEAVLIKVAGIGLCTKHLGKSLAEMQPILINLNNLYGAHICGEGGEYESLTLDCPLFKSRIVLTEVETVIHSDGDFATVAYLRVKNAVLQRKPEYSESEIEVRIPPLLNDTFTDVRNAVIESQTVSSQDGHGSDRADYPIQTLSDPGPSHRRSGPWVTVTNISHKISQGFCSVSLEEEVLDCFDQLRGRLAEYSLDLSQCSNINIYLSSMDYFARVNAVYTTLFGSSPPARACIAVDLPASTRIKLDCMAYVERSSSDRLALHVQGLSYWAPANIGPYSQAVMAAERIFISGQIGLTPSSLTLPTPQSLALETALCLQHTQRVVDAFKESTGGWKGHTQAALYWLAKPGDLAHVKSACEVYSQDSCSPTLFLAVKSLPRGALVEKQLVLHSGRFLVEDEEGDVSWQNYTPVREEGDISDNDTTIHWEISRFTETNTSCAIICFSGDQNKISMADIRAVPSLEALLDRTISTRLFHKATIAVSSTALVAFVDINQHHLPLTTIPCRMISSRKVDDWDFALCVLGT